MFIRTRNSPQHVCFFPFIHNCNVLFSSPSILACQWFKKTKKITVQRRNLTESIRMSVKQHLNKRFFSKKLFVKQIKPNVCHTWNKNGRCNAKPVSDKLSGKVNLEVFEVRKMTFYSYNDHFHELKKKMIILQKPSDWLLNSYSQAAEMMAKSKQTIWVSEWVTPSKEMSLE